MQSTSCLPDNYDLFARVVVHLPFSVRMTDRRSALFFSSLSHLRPETVSLARPLLAITLVFFLLCSAAFSQPGFRPETGTSIKELERDGYGVLIIHNNWTMDTVAVIADKDVKPLIAVYIRSKDSLEIAGIEDGSYGLYFTVGNLWDEKEGKFKSVLGYYRYGSSLDFQTAETDEDIEYSIFELDLYQARASNFVPDRFTFPDLSP
jgi:hypothetical protein